MNGKQRLAGAMVIILVGAAAMVGAKLLLPLWQQYRQRSTSDAGEIQGTIRLARDNWIGYFPLCSARMRAELRRAGWNLVCEDDQADYRARFQALASGKIQMAVATVDSYLLAGQEAGYPGAMVMVIDESRGGDAILARSGVADNLDGLRGLDGPRVAFTPDSPSHHLLKAAAGHFNLPALLPPAGPLRIATRGSAEARRALEQGRADVAALWEPDVSRALAAGGVVKLLGTEDTRRLIVDTLVAGRDFIAGRPEAVSALLEAYFQTLRFYRRNPGILLEEVRQETGLDADTARTMLAGVHWAGLNENAEEWFGLDGPAGRGEEGLSLTIESAAGILVEAGDFPRSPVPDDNPYRLIKRSFIEELTVRHASGFASGGAAQGADGDFQPLDPAQWDTLEEVGALRIEPIIFPAGSSEPNALAREKLARAAERISHYPRFRILVKGHTGTRGDSEANMRLSEERARAVADLLVSAHHIDPDRILARGYGDTAPLPRRKGESLRAWQRRLYRVEIVLMREGL